MEWRKGRRSNNVEDRRGQSGGFGGFGMPSGGIRLKGGSLIFIIAIIFFFGGDLLKSLMGGGSALPSSSSTSGRTSQSIPGVDSRDIFAEIFGNQPTTRPSSNGQTPREQLDDIFSGQPGMKETRSSEDVLSEILQGHEHSHTQIVPKSRYPNDVDADFVTAILGSTEDVWSAVFPRGQYQPPKLVLYDHGTRTGCGYGSSASGPFYCPADGKVYLDTDFFKELARIGGSGDFAQAYVVAHEVAHHVQQLTGTSQRMRQLQQRYPGSKNELSVMLELQADCMAGVWAHHSHQQLNWLDAGDLQEGMRAAGAIGDDRLTRGMIPAESFTHGTSKQRQEWLLRGFNSGDVRSCNTFKVMAGLDGF